VARFEELALAYTPKLAGRFTKAVEDLGKMDSAPPPSAIFAALDRKLAQLARTNPEEWPAMTVLGSKGGDSKASLLAQWRRTTSVPRCACGAQWSRPPADTTSAATGRHCLAPPCTRPGYNGSASSACVSAAKSTVRDL
jgi:hypothetical protein